MIVLKNLELGQRIGALLAISVSIRAGTADNIYFAREAVMIWKGKDAKDSVS